MSSLAEKKVKISRLLYTQPQLALIYEWVKAGVINKREFLELMDDILYDYHYDKCDSCRPY